MTSVIGDADEVPIKGMFDSGGFPISARGMRAAEFECRSQAGRSTNYSAANCASDLLKNGLRVVWASAESGSP